MPIKSHSSVELTQKPQAVIFDLDHTLYDYNIAHTAAMRALEGQLAEDYKLPAETCQELYARSRALTHKQLGHTASSHSRLLYCQHLFEEMGLKSQPMRAFMLEQCYWRAFFQAMTLFPKVNELLAFLRMEAISVSLVTDLTASIQFRKLIYLDIDTDFDWVVTSEEAGTDKVGGKPFECLARKLQLPQDAKVWMIGDAAADGLPVKAIFPQAVCFQRGREPHPGVDVTFSHFTNILDCLKGQPERIQKIYTKEKSLT